jgi:hypothetical protein
MAASREEGGHPLGRPFVGAGQQVRVRREHGVRIVAKTSGHDVNGDALSERERRRRVSEYVQRSRGQAGSLP